MPNPAARQRRFMRGVSGGATPRDRYVGGEKAVKKAEAAAGRAGAAEAMGGLIKEAIRQNKRGGEKAGDTKKLLKSADKYRHRAKSKARRKVYRKSM